MPSNDTSEWDSHTSLTTTGDGLFGAELDPGLGRRILHRVSPAIVGADPLTGDIVGFLHPAIGFELFD